MGTEHNEDVDRESGHTEINAAMEQMLFQDSKLVLASYERDAGIPCSQTRNERVPHEHDDSRVDA